VAQDEQVTTVKISAKKNSDLLTIKFDGRLAGPVVAELDGEWHKLAEDLGPYSKVAVDLRDLTFADSSGTRLLAEIYKQTRSEFLADTPLSRYFAQKAIAQAQHEAQGKITSNHAD
jgi:anti-anti-sigma factor